MDVSVLPPGQRACYEAILDHIEDTGSLPTIRDLAARLSIGSSNGVICHLTALRLKGFIERHVKADGPGGVSKSRTICPVGMRDDIRRLAASLRRKAGMEPAGANHGGDCGVCDRDPCD